MPYVTPGPRFDCAECGLSTSFSWGVAVLVGDRLIGLYGKVCGTRVRTRTPGARMTDARRFQR